MMPRLVLLWADRPLIGTLRRVNALLSVLEFRVEGRLVASLYLALPVDDLRRLETLLFTEEEEGGSGSG